MSLIEVLQLVGALGSCGMIGSIFVWKGRQDKTISILEGDRVETRKAIDGLKLDLIARDQKQNEHNLEMLERVHQIELSIARSVRLAD